MFAWSDRDFVAEYMLDAWQRSILFVDTLRQHGNINQEHNSSSVPNVLPFKAELVVDGRQPRGFLKSQQASRLHRVKVLFNGAGKNLHSGAARA